jgi:hypothetical protein
MLVAKAMVAHFVKTEKSAKLRAASSFSDTIELLKAHAQVFRKTSPWRAFHTREYARISRE